WERPTPAPLPANWEEHKDASGRTYYHNSETGRTQWTQPSEKSPGQVALSVPSSTPLPPALWMQLQDPTSGRIFYWNTVTHESRWDHPSSTTAAATVSASAV